MSRASALAGPRAKARRPADAPAFPARSNDGRNTGELAVLLAALLPVLSACVAPAGTASDAVGPEKGHATGKVVDTRGNAVAGAKILLDNTVFYASYINGSTRPDGTYRIRLQPGAWKAQASLVREYNGRTYSLRLHPDNIDAFDEQGAVRNFTWKLEGRHPESDYGYYGGFIQLSTDLDFSSDLDDIELTLTPSGPLIDGSPGKALQLRLGDHYWRDRYQIEDIPIGRYTVRATLKDSGGDRRLRIQDWHARGEFQHAFQLDFIPKPGNGVDNATSIVIGD